MSGKQILDTFYKLHFGLYKRGWGYRFYRETKSQYTLPNGSDKTIIKSSALICLAGKGLHLKGLLKAF